MLKAFAWDDRDRSSGRFLDFNHPIHRASSFSNFGSCVDQRFETISENRGQGKVEI